MMMKYFVALSCVASALVAMPSCEALPQRYRQAGGHSSPKSQPGFCDEPKDCKAEGFECVALQTTRSGAQEVKQCVPMHQNSDVCSGAKPGLCPSFSSWVAPYKQISSLCTYKPAKKCARNPAGPSVRGEIICVPGAHDLDDAPLKVIYGCVDVDISEQTLGFIENEDSNQLARKLNTVETVVAACLNPNVSNTSAALLCDGHGTCLPTGVASLEYECHCNVGYSGQYCDKKDSNKCALPGQCSAGECNLDKQVCECPAGTTGNQCGDCDASSSSACNDNGKCVNKKCVCSSGLYGDHCDQKVANAPAKKQKTKSHVKRNKNQSTEEAAANDAVPRVSMQTQIALLLVLSIAIQL